MLAKVLIHFFQSTKVGLNFSMYIMKPSAISAWPLAQNFIGLKKSLNIAVYNMIN